MGREWGEVNEDEKRWRRRNAGAPGRGPAPVICLCIFALSALAEGALDPIRGPRVNPEPGSITPLQRQLQEAVLMGDTKLLNITNLITAGADPNGYDENHMTPLHWAVIKGQRLCVELLLQRGAHTDVRDSSYRTPMHFVAIYGRVCAFAMSPGAPASAADRGRRSQRRMGDGVSVHSHGAILRRS